MKANVIIQARSESTRLPGKVLLKIMDKTILEYLVERVKKAKNIKDIIVATTTKEEDSHIVNLVRKLKVNAFRGSEDDVLDRFYQAAKMFNAKHIVRITADCPFMDPKIIDDAVSYYFKSGADYCSNVLERTFPDGEDIEVFSFSALERAWKDANLTSEREHVTPYIVKHPEKFNLTNFKNETDFSENRWTLDRVEDFRFIKAILEVLYPANPDFHMEDILEFLKRNPQLKDINRNIKLNEGYAKSTKEDRILNKGEIEG
jgi:spore coat polysaccharide biosynthesis protein SpsF